MYLCFQFYELSMLLNYQIYFGTVAASKVTFRKLTNLDHEFCKHCYSPTSIKRLPWGL